MSKPQGVNAELLRAMPPPALPKDADKEARGQVLVVAGGMRAPGAAILAATAALRVGAGKLAMAAPRDSAMALAFQMVEALVAGVPAKADGDISVDAADAVAEMADRADAVVLGPGMTDEDTAGALAAAMLTKTQAPAFVLDAAALTGLKKHIAAVAANGGRAVLTPHAGEMAALLERDRAAVEAEPLACALRLAQMTSQVVVMKGVQTFILSPDGRAFVNDGGRSGLGTSGSGDVLAGLIGGMLARGCPPVTAAIWGVHLHAQAGLALGRKVGPLGFLAREISGEIPAMLADLSRREV